MRLGWRVILESLLIGSFDNSCEFWQRKLVLCSIAVARRIRVRQQPINAPSLVQNATHHFSSCEDENPGRNPLFLFRPSRVRRDEDGRVGADVGNDELGFIAWPGQHNGFKFTGTAGQRLYYDALDLDYENITVTLYAPNGSVVSGFSTNHSSDFGPFYLPENGGYTLLFQGVGDTIGDYNFRLFDVTNAPLVGYGTNIVGQLNPRSSAAVTGSTARTGSD